MDRPLTRAQRRRCEDELHSLILNSIDDKISTQEIKSYIILSSLNENEMQPEFPRQDRDVTSRSRERPGLTRERAEPQQTLTRVCRRSPRQLPEDAARRPRRRLTDSAASFGRSRTKLTETHDPG